jgi:hypothetical protein
VRSPGGGSISSSLEPRAFVVGRLGDPAWVRVFESLTAVNQSSTKSAPVLFAWFAKKTFCQNGAANRVAPHDAGVASAQISLGATTHGLYNHGMAVFEPEWVAMSFGVPKDFEAVACWALGYRGDPVTLNKQPSQMDLFPRKRMAFAEIVFRAWG